MRIEGKERNGRWGIVVAAKRERARGKKWLQRIWNFGVKGLGEDGTRKGREEGRKMSNERRVGKRGEEEWGLRLGR